MEQVELVQAPVQELVPALSALEQVSLPLSS